MAKKSFVMKATFKYNKKRKEPNIEPSCMQYEILIGPEEASSQCVNNFHSIR